MLNSCVTLMSDAQACSLFKRVTWSLCNACSLVLSPVCRSTCVAPPTCAVFRLSNQRFVRSFHFVSFPTAVSLSYAPCSHRSRDTTPVLHSGWRGLTHYYPEKLSCKSSKVNRDYGEEHVIKNLHTAL